MNNSFLSDPPEVFAGCIEIYDNVILNSKKIVDLANKKNNWNEASIISEKEVENVIDKKIRSNKFMTINQFSYEIEPEFYDMCKTVWIYVNNYAKKYDVPFFATEPVQILKYAPGEFYQAHHDHNVKSPRVISAILYLNDVESGGETEFVNFDLKVKPKEGRLVIFPSNYAYSHAARLPENGYKYVAVFWMVG